MDITNKIDRLLDEGKFTWYGSGAKGRPVVKGVDYNLAKKYGFESKVKDKTGYVISGIFPKGNKWTNLDGGIEVYISIDDYLGLATGESDKALARVQVINTMGDKYEEVIHKDHFIYNIKGDQGIKGMETLMKQYSTMAEKEAQKELKDIK